jgi:hypothetical protein
MCEETKMTPTIPDLWPPLGETPQTTPLAILREQGRLLGQKTANQVYGEVQTKADSEDGSFRHILWVVAPFLAYRKPLAVATHKVGFYPVQVGPAKEVPPPGFIVARPSTTASTPEEFMQALQTVLASEDNVKLLNALIAQSTEPVPA